MEPPVIEDDDDLDPLDWWIEMDQLGL